MYSYLYSRAPKSKSSGGGKGVASRAKKSTAASRMVEESSKFKSAEYVNSDDDSSISEEETTTRGWVWLIPPAIHTSLCFCLGTRSGKSKGKDDGLVSLPSGDEAESEGEAELTSGEEESESD